MTLPFTPDEAEAVASDRWSTSVAAAKEAGFGWFDWLSVVDTDDGNLTVVLHLWDRVGHTSRFLRTTVATGGSVPSVTAVFPGAGWHEREAAEMFGLRFEGAPDPRPLLLPDGFVGHPLRKDFPLAARGLGEWPGAHEPAEHGPAARPPGRRRPTATGVPDWPAPDQPTSEQPTSEQPTSDQPTSGQPVPPTAEPPRPEEQP